MAFKSTMTPFGQRLEATILRQRTKDLQEIFGSLVEDLGGTVTDRNNRNCSASLKTGYGQLDLKLRCRDDGCAWLTGAFAETFPGIALPEAIAGVPYVFSEAAGRVAFDMHFSGQTEISRIHDDLTIFFEGLKVIL